MGWENENLIKSHIGMLFNFMKSFSLFCTPERFILENFVKKFNIPSNLQ